MRLGRLGTSPGNILRYHPEKKICDSTYNNSGVTIKFGGHQNSSRPSSYSGAVKNYVSSAHWNKPEQAWRSISTWFGKAFRDNVIKGVLIDQGTDNASSYGYAAGVNDQGYGLPKIRITYTK